MATIHIFLVLAILYYLVQDDLVIDLQFAGRNKPGDLLTDYSDGILKTRSTKVIKLQGKTSMQLVNFQDV